MIFIPFNPPPPKKRKIKNPTNKNPRLVFDEEYVQTRKKGSFKQAKASQDCETFTMKSNNIIY